MMEPRPFLVDPLDSLDREPRGSQGGGARGGSQGGEPGEQTVLQVADNAGHVGVLLRENGAFWADVVGDRYLALQSVQAVLLTRPSAAPL